MRARVPAGTRSQSGCAADASSIARRASAASASIASPMTRSRSAGRAAGSALAVLLHAADDRPCVQRARERIPARGGELTLRDAVRQVDARRIGALGPENTAWRRDSRMRATARALHVRDRIPDDLIDRQRLVDDPVDERSVGAVLQQPPDQVRKQFLVRADGRIDATWQRAAGGVGQFRIEFLAHAVQSLEFELPASCARQPDDGGCGVRVVSRELRVNPAGAFEQYSRAGEIGDVRVGLACIDRVAGQAALLGTLDLAVPVRALDESQVQHAPAFVRTALQVAQDVGRALRIRLHGEAEAVPTGKRWCSRAVGRSAAGTTRAARPPPRRS